MRRERSTNCAMGERAQQAYEDDRRRALRQMPLRYRAAANLKAMAFTAAVGFLLFLAFVFPLSAMPICGSGKRITCVVDGDTIWLNGEKIRIEGIDAPEVRGSCRYETDLAAKATERLGAIIGDRPLQLERNGQDRYGRTLARVKIDNFYAGDVLVSEGLARLWTGRKEEWCGG